MAELVYAFDLKSNGEIHMGSSPISGTRRSLLQLHPKNFWIRLEITDRKSVSVLAPRFFVVCKMPSHLQPVE